MSRLFLSTMNRLMPALRQGDLDACESEVAGEMQKLPRSPFDTVLDVSITNDPEDAAQHFDRFFERESKRFQIGAAYTEMNDFSINPDRWFCGLCAYAEDGGDDEYDWLSDCQSKRFEDYTITGLERLQHVYASTAFRDKQNRSASYMSSLMVVTKFQKFMRQAFPLMKMLNFPLYVTAHDFKFIASFDPRPASSRTPIRKRSIEEQRHEFILNLSNEDPDKRFRAATNVYSMGPAAKQATEPLIRRLDDSHLPMRGFAILALAQIDPESDIVVSALVAMFESNQPPNIRQEIVRALGKSPTPKAIETLAKAALDEDTGVRRYAVISLKLLGGKAKAAVPALKKLMETETDRDVRTQATVALERMRE